jgi:hypothetical protein
LQLSTDLWVSALIRRAELGGAFASVVRKGDPRAGAVLVKLFNPLTREARLYSQALRGAGDAVWMQPAEARDEPDLDAFIAKQRGYDPDLWVVEIEDRQGRHFLTEPVEGEKS